jgi:hypothetical protein
VWLAVQATLSNTTFNRPCQIDAGVTHCQTVLGRFEPWREVEQSFRSIIGPFFLPNRVKVLLVFS